MTDKNIGLNIQARLDRSSTQKVKADLIKDIQNTGDLAGKEMGTRVSNSYIKTLKSQLTAKQKEVESYLSSPFGNFAQGTKGALEALKQINNELQKQKSLMDQINRGNKFMGQPSTSQIMQMQRGSTMNQINSLLNPRGGSSAINSLMGNFGYQYQGIMGQIPADPTSAQINRMMRSSIMNRINPVLKATTRPTSLVDQINQKLANSFGGYLLANTIGGRYGSSIFALNGMLAETNMAKTGIGSMIGLGTPLTGLGLAAAAGITTGAYRLGRFATNAVGLNSEGLNRYVGYEKESVAALAQMDPSQRRANYGDNMQAALSKYMNQVLDLSNKLYDIPTQQVFEASKLLAGLNLTKAERETLLTSVATYRRLSGDQTDMTQLSSDFYKLYQSLLVNKSISPGASEAERMKQIGKIASLAFITNKVSPITPQELSSSIGTLANIQLGTKTDIADLFTEFSLLTSTGMSGSTARVAMENFSKNLRMGVKGRGSMPVWQILQNSGVQTKDSTGTFLREDVIVGNLLQWAANNKMGNKTDQLLSLVFGNNIRTQRGINVGAALRENPTLMNDIVNQFKLANTTSGGMDSAFWKTATPGQSVTALGKSWQILQDKTILAVAPLIGNFAQRLAGTADTTKSFDDVIQEAVDIAKQNGMSDSMQNMIKAIGKFGNSILDTLNGKDLPGVFSDLIDVVTAFTSALSLLISPIKKMQKELDKLLEYAGLGTSEKNWGGPLMNGIDTTSDKFVKSEFSGSVNEQMVKHPYLELFNEAYLRYTKQWPKELDKGGFFGENGVLNVNVQNNITQGSDGKIGVESKATTDNKHSPSTATTTKK